MLFRSARSRSFREAFDNRTSKDEVDLGKSDAAGVGGLLVAGVEYSDSEVLSKGVGTEETDSLVIVDALLGLPRRGFMVLELSSGTATTGTLVTLGGRPRRLGG
jgi:hypothetical protein